MSDPISDLLTRMRNAQHARYEVCECPWSRHKQEICEVLAQQGFIAQVTVEGEGKDKVLLIEFNPLQEALSLKRVSKPGRRVYQGTKEMKPVLRGYGIAILSTSQGVMTDQEARKKGIGGEVLCTVS